MIKYFKEKRYRYRQIAIVVLLLLIGSVIPLLYIGRFAHPCADDFTYGYLAHGFWTTTGSVWEALKWAVNQVKATYDTWQGTFSSAFLMAVSPAVWSENWYAVTPVIMLTMVIVPHFCLMHMLLVRLLGASKSIWVAISGILVFCMVEHITSPVNAFFWYNGAVHYIFMHGCMLLLYTVMIRLILERAATACGKGKYAGICAIACFLSVICGGSNYATALTGILGVSGILALQLIGGRKRVTDWLPLVCYGAAFYLNVTAYGNTVRQTNFVKAAPADAVIQSFVQLFEKIQLWSTVPVLLFLLLLVPLWWQAVGTEQYRFRFPLAVTVLSVCACACMLTPSLYATNAPGPDRLLNVVQIWFYLLLFGNEGYWIGWLRKILEKQGKAEGLCRRLPDVRWFAAVVLVLLAAEFVINVNGRLTQYSTYAAYVSLRAGEVQQYHREYLDRLEILNGEEKKVSLPEFTQKPRLLYFDDITEDPYDWRNAAVANWYQKDTVILQRKE